MAALSPAGQDRLLMLGIGLTAVAVIGLMRRMLIVYRDSAAIPASESKPQYITQDVEDSLKASTLNKLLDSPNYNIQETTSIIVCERALHDSATINALLWYITRPDHDEREKGIRALTMLMNSSTVAIINKPQTYAALVQCLEFAVNDYEHNPYDPDWDNWGLRDVVEQGCLLVLSHLVGRYGVGELVKSRFIERWLVKEPWGDDEQTRRANFTGSMARDNRLNEIVAQLFKNREALKQLEKVKLISGAILSELGISRDVRMVNGESTAGEDFDAMFAETRRIRDQNAGDDHLRRRHREAMVLNDGTRPLERGDIFERVTRS